MKSSSKLGSVVAVSNEVIDLKSAVRKLQKDSDEQLLLEKETQATFEHLSIQLAALRRSMGLLADVMMQEMDELKVWVRKKCNDTEDKVEGCVVTVQGLSREVANMRVICEELSDRVNGEELKRGEQVDRLLASHDVLAEELKETKRAQVAGLTTVIEEIASTKKHSEKQQKETRVCIGDMESALGKLKLEIKKLQTKRMEDLDLMEGALSKVQEQQVRSLQASDENVHRIGNDIGSLRARVEAVDNALSGLRVDVLDLRDRSSLRDKDVTQRFEHTRAVIRALGEALGMSEMPSGVP